MKTITTIYADEKCGDIEDNINLIEDIGDLFLLFKMVMDKADEGYYNFKVQRVNGFDDNGDFFDDLIIDFTKGKNKWEYIRVRMANGNAVSN